MKKFSYIVKEEAGLHARPAALVVNQAKKYQSQMFIYSEESSADATKLISIMLMGIKCGDKIWIEVCGPDEDTAVMEMKSFFETNL